METLAFCLDLSITQLMQLQRWCIENCEGAWYTDTLGAQDSWGRVIRYRWRFESQSDFVNFSLTHSDMQK